MSMKIFSHAIDVTFIRFVLIGLLNTAFGVGVYCLFVYWGIPYRVAVLLNFKTIGTFVFRNTKNRLIFKFVAAYVIVYFINIGLIHLLLELSDLNEYIAGIIVTPIVAIASFVLQKRFVFN